MDERSESGVSEVLRRHGLEGPAFDVAAVAEGLEAVRAEGRQLERMLESRDVEYATTFDPEWR